MKTLTVLFTFNRPLLLDNCLRSFWKFAPGNPLLILDDGSDDPVQKDVLSKAALQADTRVVKFEHDRNRRLGGLYANMAWSYRLALDEGMDYVHFLQDDQQFLWHDPSFWSRCDELFQHCPSAYELTPGFDWLIFSHVHHKRSQWNAEAGCWKRLNSAFMAPGVFHVPRMHENGWVFAESEVANHLQARAKGLELIASPAPSVGKVPSAPVRHAGRKHRKEMAPRKEFYLLPLDEQALTQLCQVPKSRPPLYEEYCIPWGWRAWAPYHYSNNLVKHLQNLRRWIKGNHFRSWPYRIGTESRKA
ncbi:MAG: glycosyltransferase family A protein [Candidatus Methylacidiphilales bacterium]|nr:glycosyltransferase family A protein [Candidatus Methylacidiphilales bacterium]